MLREEINSSGLRFLNPLGPHTASLMINIIAGGRNAPLTKEQL
jgi:hypothetical protein